MGDPIQEFQTGRDRFIEAVNEGQVLPETEQDTYDVREETGNIYLPVDGNDQELYLLPGPDIHEQSLTHLRRLPQYLCDAILLPHKTTAPLDSYLYWAWTAAVASSLTFSGRHFDFEDTVFLWDFLSTVHMTLLPLRHHRLDEDDQQTIADLNPSIEGLRYAGIRFAATIGCSILDGFISRHCDELDQDGELVSGSLNASWRPDGRITNPPNFHDRVQVWREYQASQDTKHSLDAINDLTRYDVDVLRGKLEGSGDILEEERESTNNFLRVMKEQRDYNIHGSGSTQVIGPIVLNLCCLVIWDQIPEDEFDTYREGTLAELVDPSQLSDDIDMDIPRGSNPYTARAFYPI